MGYMFSINDVYSKMINQQQDQNNLRYKKSDVEFILSPNLASQFTDTINQFTGICAKMVEARTINKELYQKFDQLYTKIKNLIDAAKNSN